MSHHPLHQPWAASQPAAFAYQQYVLPLQPTGLGTVAFLLSLLLSLIWMDAQANPSTIARLVALTVGAGLATSIALDSKRGLRNLFRADLVCLLALYFLTLVEFLFPQDRFDTLISAQQTIQALEVVLVGMAALTLGRHLISFRARQPTWLQFGEISSKLLFRLFLASALLGFLYMLLSVQFNLVLMISDMMNPRFTQPWSRGRLGDWRSLLIELNLLLYLIPPLTGVIWNRRGSYSRLQIALVLAIFLLTLFQGFASGTRNVFLAYVATFLGGYLLTLHRHTFRNTVIPVTLAIALAFFASYHMLEFRTVGLRNYLEGNLSANYTARDTFLVDYNLYILGLLTDIFPQQHGYLGFEILIWALSRPIPRVFWPDKPTGLSFGIEDAVGVSGYTLSATYLGESYMSGGMIAVILISLVFGAIAAWWNNVALQQYSSYAMVVYAAGFFVAAISMRSMITFTTALLPVIALIVFRNVVIPLLRR